MLFKSSLLRLFSIDKKAVIGSLLHTKDFKSENDIKNIENLLKTKDRIFINDGIVQLRVEKKDGKDLICTVLNGGTISEFKGCNVPSELINIDGIFSNHYKLLTPFPVVTEKDEIDLKLIAELDPEYVAGIIRI